MNLKDIYNNPQLLEVGRKAVEDTLIDFRNNRISQFGRNNGLVVKEYNGNDSNIIRLGTEDALRIGLKAIAEYLKE
jgi:hypothetical protein